jgi:hypothetical protein
MSEPTDGGPAFPSIAGFENSYGQLKAKGGSTGMSLRDYFAGLAMQSIMAHLPQGIRPQDCIRAAEDAYFIADAMLRARTTGASNA